MNAIINEIDEVIASLSNDRDCEFNEEEHELSADNIEYICNVYDQCITALQRVQGVMLGEGVEVAVPRATIDFEAMGRVREALNREPPPPVRQRWVNEQVENWIGESRRNAQMTAEQLGHVDDTEEIRAVVEATPIQEQAQVRAVGF